MSYIVFARKWRPRGFDEVIGQEHVTVTLKNAISLGRIAHAYLFAGPRGVGKTTVARIFAKALNCEKGPTAKPCNVCASCKEVMSGNSIDVLEIDGASNRGIDEVRSLRENIRFSPIGSKFKVYIIDEVHQITPDAFNALLKTLEEPPPHVKFIFATTQPHKVPGTILSRCQRFDFKRITLDLIISKLKNIVREEKIKMDEEVLFTIARAADGSMRDAEVLLDQLNCATEGKIKIKDASEMLGVIEQDMLFDIGDKILNNQTKDLLLLLDKIISDGKDLNYFLNSLIEHFRNLLMSRVVKERFRSIVDLPGELLEKVAAQGGKFSQEELFYILQVLAHTQEISKRAISVRFAVELAFIKITARNQLGSIEDILNKISRMKDNPEKEKNNPGVYARPANVSQLPRQEEKEKSGPSKEDYSANPDKNVSFNAVSLEQVKAIWSELIEELKKYKMSCGTYFSEGAPLKIEEDILTVGFGPDKNLHREILEETDNRKAIEARLNRLLNSDLKINLVTVKEEPAKDTINGVEGDAPGSDDKKNDTQNGPGAAKNNPAVDKILKIFGGTVVG